MRWPHPHTPPFFFWKLFLKSEMFVFNEPGVLVRCRGRHDSARPQQSTSQHAWKPCVGGERRKRGRGVSAQKKCEGRKFFFYFGWKSPRGGGMRFSVITCLPRSLELFLLLRNSDNTASQWKTKRPLWLVSRLRPISLPLRRLLWNKVGLTCKM